MKELLHSSRWQAVPALIAEAGRVGLPLNVICLNAAMSVLAWSGRWFEALDLLSKMRRGALLVDVDGDPDQGRELREPLVKAKLVLPEPDTITFNAAIRACGRGKKWKVAVGLLDDMRQEGLVPDGFSYSAAISACKNCGQWEMALDLLEDMKKRGLAKDRHSINAAIAACASAGRWEPAMKLLKGMETDGPDPDVFTYASVIDALAQGGKVDLALRTLQRMRSDPARYPAPNTVCFNAALMALTRHGHWREARSLLKDVAAVGDGDAGDQTAGVTGAGGGGGAGSGVLDFLSYNSVIRACAAAGEAKEAFETREEMRAAGIPADAYTYEALSIACGLAGDWAAAEAVLREMMAGCSADPAPAVAVASPPAAAAAGLDSAATVSAAVGDGAAGSKAASSTGSGPWNPQRHRQRRRQERLNLGVPPSPKMFHGLMEAYARAGEWERAQECLDDMLHGSKGLPPDEAVAAEGQKQERVGVRAGVKPDSTSVGWAMKACADAGQWDRALAMFTGARSEGIEPGQLCFDAALLACAVGGQGSRATSLLAEMASLESRPLLTRKFGQEKNANFSASTRSPKQQVGEDGVAQREGGAVVAAPADSGGSGGSGGGGSVPQPSDGMAPRRTTESYRLGIEACRRGGDTRGALSTLAILKEEGFRPDLACFNEALWACAEGGGRFERAVSLLDEMRGAGLSPDNASYSAVLRACESCRDQEGAAKTAFGLIQKMSSPEPADADANIDIDVGADANRDGGGGGTKREGAGPSPPAPLSPPDARDFLAALRACAGGGGCPGSPSLALRLLTDIKVSAAAAARATSAAQSATATAVETRGPREPAAGSMQLLPEHYCAALTACGRGGNTQGILDLLSELRQGGPNGASEAAAAGGLRPWPSLGASVSPADGAEGRGAQQSGAAGDLKESEKSAGATREAAEAGITPCLSAAVYSAAANALADVGEWEWCLVLLEELEQLDETQEEQATRPRGPTADPLQPAPPPPLTRAAAPDGRSEPPGTGDKQEQAETVLEVELDEHGVPITPGTAPDNIGAPSSAEKSAVYTAAIRACGKGGAGVEAILGILDRMRWAGVEPGEDAYFAAISAFRACGGDWEGVQEAGGVMEISEAGAAVEDGAARVVSVQQAARALIEYEADRDSSGWASPFLYSAAIKACAGDGDIATGKLLFIEGRRAAGIATDKAADVAAAAVAAAADAAKSGTAPVAPRRVNAGVEAVYMSCLALSAAAGDGSLARDVLRWMKLEGFQASEEAYMLAIEACCTPAVPQDPPTTEHPQASSSTPPPRRPPTPWQPPPPPAPQRASRGTWEDTSEVRRELLPVGLDSGRAAGGASESFSADVSAASRPSASAVDAAVTGGRDESMGVRNADVGADEVPSAGLGAAGIIASANNDVDLDEEGDRERGAKDPTAEELRRQRQRQRSSPPASMPSQSATKERKGQDFEWVVIPGGRESPPEFDEDGNEIIGLPGAMGGSMGKGWEAGGAGARGFGGSPDTPSRRQEAAKTSAASASRDAQEAAKTSAASASRDTQEAAKTSAASASRDTEGEKSASPFPPVVASRAGAVNVLSRAVAPQARRGGEGGGERYVPRDADSDAAAGGSAPPPESGDSSRQGRSANAGSGDRPVETSGGSDDAAERGEVDWQRAKAILDDMTAADYLPLPPFEAFQAVLRACDAAGKVGEALEVARAMTGAGYTPGFRMMSRLMASYSEELDRERREAEEAAAEPADEWE